MPKNYDEFAIARRRLGCSRMQWGSFGWKTTTSARIGGGCTGTHKAQCSEPDKGYPRTVANCWSPLIVRPQIDHQALFTWVK